MTNGHVPGDPEVRTYRGRTLEEVLPQIRAELGPDAVVVRQRDGLMGGIGGFFQQQFVEVEARGGAMRVDVYDDEPALPAPATGAESEPSEPSAAEAAPAPSAEEPRAPAPAPAPAPRPARAPRTAAELLAQAGDAGVDDPRSPAEILREHSATFARQLAAAEERAEPVVIATPPEAPAHEAPAGEASTGRYAPPVPASRTEPTPLPRPAPPAPAPAPAPDDELPPAAEAARAAEAEAATAPPAPAPAAAAAARRAPAKKRRPARARVARPAAAAAKPAAGAEPASAGRAEAVVEAAASAQAAPAAQPRPAAARRARRAFEPPEGGVGPQTTQALELAAALAANVATRPPDALQEGPIAAAALTEPRAAEQPESQPEPPAAPSAAEQPRPACATAPPTAAPQTRPPAPRRGLFGRLRAVPLPLAQIAGSPAGAAVTTALTERGIAPAVARDVIVDAAAHVLPFAADGDLQAAARTALARRIPTPEPPPLGGRAVAFVGAGGAGKTRCVAGLAAAYAGGSTVPVVVVSLAAADGGAELAALLKPHGVRVEPFASAQAAARRIAQARDESLVVLDTPAVSPADVAGVEALAVQLAPLALDETQLVVPATLSAAVAQELLERLARLEPTGIAMTHADATEHIGAVVELACATRVPLAYVNSGLALPGALAPADAAQLAERLLS